jgi:hypothetical protein
VRIFRRFHNEKGAQAKFFGNIVKVGKIVISNRTDSLKSLGEQKSRAARFIILLLTFSTEMVYITVTKNSASTLMVETLTGQRLSLLHSITCIHKIRLVQNGNLHTETAKLVSQGFKLVHAAGGNESLVLVFHKDGAGES